MNKDLPIIETEIMSDIFTKYHIYNLGFDAVIHKFKEAEPLSARAHDHPFTFTTFIMNGWYIERIWSKVYTMSGRNVWKYRDIKRRQGISYKIKADHIHQVIAMSEGGCTTIILPEKKEKDWRFYEFKKEGYNYIQV